MSDKTAEDFELPETFAERMERFKPPTDKRLFFDKEANEKARKEYMWAAPLDPRFPQQNSTRHCMTYYVDYQRCITLKGEDYKPCKYFQKIYKDVCPKYWYEKWDEWVEEGRFPARFDR